VYNGYGKFRVGVRTSKKKLKAKKQAAKAWLRKQLMKPIVSTMETLAAVVRGHCNYYGVSGNFIQIQNFLKYLMYETYRMLNHRDQKGKLRYPSSCEFGTSILRSLNWWSISGTGSQRLLEEPYAEKPHVRFREGQRYSFTYEYCESRVELSTQQNGEFSDKTHTNNSYVTPIEYSIKRLFGYFH